MAGTDRKGCDLREELREVLRRECAYGGLGGIVRVETVIPRKDALAWLRAQAPPSVKMYWGRP